jgi:hypothetical protein
MSCYGVPEKSKSFQAFQFVAIALCVPVPVWRFVSRCCILMLARIRILFIATDETAHVVAVPVGASIDWFDQWVIGIRGGDPREGKGGHGAHACRKPHGDSERKGDAFEVQKKSWLAHV